MSLKKILKYKKLYQNVGYVFQNLFGLFIEAY